MRLVITGGIGSGSIVFETVGVMLDQISRATTVFWQAGNQVELTLFKLSFWDGEIGLSGLAAVLVVTT